MNNVFSQILAAAFEDELEKIAARIGAMHATNFPYEVLVPRSLSGKASNLVSDPNVASVYMATKNKKRLKALRGFARSAVESHKGSPYVGYTKIDTKDYRPHALTDWARKEKWTREDLEDLTSQLDEPGLLKGDDRAEVWQIINRAVGAWAPRDPLRSVRVRKWERLE